MALRCLLFTSDEGTAQSVRQALSDLGVESEHCTVAVEAVQKVTNNPFNLLIVDWDNQSEATFLLKTARERKALDRPLTLAIVSQDLNVTQALQAGANSILRKPIVAAQARDSLTSARDLVRSRQDASLASAQAAAAGASAVNKTPGASQDGSKKALRAGEFLQSSTTPGTQFITEADVQGKIQKTIEQAEVAKVDLLKELEPVAAAVEKKEVLPPPTSAPAEPRGLESYLKAKRAGTSERTQLPSKPELVGYDQPQSSEVPSRTSTSTLSEPPHAPSQSVGSRASGQTDSNGTAETALFAYMSGEPASEPKAAVPKSRPWPRRAIFGGVLVAVCATAFVIVPPQRWRQNLQLLASSTIHLAHNWLNPQASTLTQVPTTHENFGLAGDEYKLPVAQNIPDATTDPTQIRVVPVIDPTAKKPNGASNTDSGAEDAAASDNPNENPPNQPPTVQVQETPQAAPSVPVTGDAAAPSPPTAGSHNIAVETHPANPPEQPTRRDPIQLQPPPPSRPRPQAVAAASSLKPSPGIPSSLTSQMASTTPDASGNKPVEAALATIEPVSVPEATARGLLLQQADPEYPATAKGQHGNVTLQVLIGRDGSVQDAKFLQGSLAFARSAIDSVKQWRFKPYNLNGRPVSIQTVLTLTFKPAS
jgi:protein TonB